MSKPTDKIPNTSSASSSLKINYTQGEDARAGRTNKHPAAEHPGHIRDVPGDYAEYKYEYNMA
jgi:hypothetical protein